MIFNDNVDVSKFNNFIENHSIGHFLQTDEWGKFKSLHTWDMKRVGLEKDGELVAASLLLSRKIPGLNKKILYSPRGFILDYNNKVFLHEFCEGIKKLAIKMGAIFVRIDPYIIRMERDIEGNAVEGGVDNTHILKNLEEEGFKHNGFSLDFNGIQPRFSMRLDISDNIKKIFNGFHSKTRYNIRLAERKGIEIIEGNKADLARFEEIMRVTGDRDGFITRPLSYFEEMYDMLVPSGKMKLFLAKYNIDNGISNHVSDLESEQEKLERYITQHSDSDDENKIAKLSKKIDICKNRIRKLEAELIELNEEKKKNPNGVIISGTILMLTGNKAWYLYGASDNMYRNLMPNHLIQWEMIKYSKKMGCNLYDFRGISGDLSEDNHLYGLYKFKKGFNTEFTEYIGEFDLIINKPLYFGWEVLLPKFKSIRRKILKRNN